MQVYHFFTPGDFRQSRFEYLAIQGESDSKFKIPLYKKQSDGKFHKLERIFFPSCTKFMHGLHVKMNEDLTPEEIEQRFGDISALPW